MMHDFSGFVKDNFRQLMIDSWMEEGCFSTEVDAIDNYGGHDFDTLIDRCDGTTLLNFKYDEGTNEQYCFEIIDNSFVIPVSAINIYSDT